jgi:EmrB/QacA subfamily drug resistance transporter
MTLPMLRPPCEEAAARAAPETPGCASHAKPWVLTATVLASSVVFLEATVIIVALPGIQQALEASVATMQWIANVYTLALAALTLIGGALGDRFGRRRLLAVGLGVFTLASLAAGLAPNSAALIVARALQGLGAALVAPNSLAHLSASFSRAERGHALGIWAAAAALTGGAAPLFGGWLVDVVSWRAVFLLCVPLTLATLAVVVTRVPESRAPRGGAALDGLGAVLAALAFAALTAGLIGAAGRAGTADAWGLLLTGLALLAAFIWWESHTGAPMMPPALFRTRAFRTANLLTLLLYAAVSGTFFLLPFTLVQAYGYSATLTGAVFLPFALLMGVLSGWAGGLIDRWGARRPLVLGPLVVAAGLTLFGLPFGAGDYWTTFAPPMAMMGLGMALTVAPLTTVVMGAVDPDTAGIASGINNTVARLASLLAVAVVGLVALSMFSSALRERVAAVAAPTGVKQALLAQRRDLGDARVPPEAGAAGPALAAALHAALADAFHAVALLSAVLALGAAGCAALGIDVRAVVVAPRGEGAAFVCEHLGQLMSVAPRSAGCEECLRAGNTWIHLRLCLACGHVGCCDASANQHATRHFRSSGHPIVQSLTSGETWRWCYLDERVV